MGKKFGMLSFVAGLAAGAAALFLSDEKNRDFAEEELGKAATKAKQLKKDFDKDPEGTVKAVAKEVEKTTKKVVRTAKKRVAAKTTKAKKQSRKKTAKK